MTTNLYWNENEGNVEEVIEKVLGNHKLGVPWSCLLPRYNGPQQLVVRGVSPWVRRPPPTL